MEQEFSKGAIRVERAIAHSLRRISGDGKNLGLMEKQREYGMMKC